MDEPKDEFSDPELGEIKMFVSVLYTKKMKTHLRFFKCCLNCKHSLTFFQDKVYNKYLGDRRTGGSEDLESGARPTSEHSGRTNKLSVRHLSIFNYPFLRKSKKNQELNYQAQNLITELLSKVEVLITII